MEVVRYQTLAAEVAHYLTRFLFENTSLRPPRDAATKFGSGGR